MKICASSPKTQQVKRGCGHLNFFSTYLYTLIKLPIKNPSTISQITAQWCVVELAVGNSIRSRVLFFCFWLLKFLSSRQL